MYKHSYTILACFLVASLTFAEERPTTAGPREAHFQVKRSEAAKMDYLLFLPPGYEQPERKWPLILYLHGTGECGTNLDFLKRNGPTKYVLSHPDFPLILVSPQTRGGWDVRALTALLDDVAGECRVERSQIYLTGLSMGGGAAWNLAATHPERFAAVVPVSGVGNPAMAGKLATLPIWVFHGARDPMISVKWSREMVAAIKAAGGTINYTEYPKDKHNIWAKTYNNPELYSWLLAQKRKPGKPIGKARIPL
jgi:predicted peptidase